MDASFEQTLQAIATSAAQTLDIGEGLLFVFDQNERERWQHKMEKAFSPSGIGCDVFGYDWHGRILAIDADAKLLVAFDAAQDGAFELCSSDIPVRDLLFGEDDILEGEAYKRWRHEHEAVEYPNCISYEIPFYLGGKDEISNMQPMSLDLYWNLSMQIADQVRNLPKGTVINNVTISD